MYTRDMFLQRFYGASKDKDFLGHFWLGIFKQDNLPVNLKQEVKPISLSLSGTEQKKRPILSIVVPHPATRRLLLLNKGASGSMKLN